MIKIYKLVQKYQSLTIFSPFYISLHSFREKKINYNVSSCLSHVILCLYILMSPCSAEETLRVPDYSLTSYSPPHLVTKGVLSQGIVTSHLPSHMGKSALDSESTIVQQHQQSFQTEGADFYSLPEHTNIPGPEVRHWPTVNSGLRIQTSPQHANLRTPAAAGKQNPSYLHYQ